MDPTMENIEGEDDLYADFKDVKDAPAKPISNKQFYEMHATEEEKLIQKDLKEQQDKHTVEIDKTFKKITQDLTTKGKLRKAIKSFNNKTGQELINESIQHMEKDNDAKAEGMRMAHDAKNKQNAKKEAMSMPKNEKRKNAQLGLQAMQAKKMAKYRKETDIKCVNIALKGKLSTCELTPDDFTDEEYTFIPIELSSLKIIFVCKALASGKNVLVEKILKCSIKGPVTALKVGDEEEFENLAVAEFRDAADKYLEAQIKSKELNETGKSS